AQFPPNLIEQDAHRAFVRIALRALLSHVERLLKHCNGFIRTIQTEPIPAAEDYAFAPENHEPGIPAAARVCEIRPFQNETRLANRLQGSFEITGDAR